MWGRGRTEIPDNRTFGGVTLFLWAIKRTRTKKRTHARTHALVSLILAEETFLRLHIICYARETKGT